MGIIQNLKDVWNTPTRKTAPPWDARLQEAAYTSISGSRLTFDYEDVSHQMTKKTTGFDFPDVSGTYVQDHGSAGRRFPMRVYFWGDNHDVEALGFESLLDEIGPGVLEHPMYGTRTVVPYGQITRRDNLKSAANQTIFEVTFWDTIGTAYPLQQTDPAGDVARALDAFTDASAAQFARQLSDVTAVERVSTLGKFRAFLDKSEASLAVIAAAQQDVADEFQGVVDSVNRTIDLAIGGPLTLAFQTKILLQAPARAVASIRANLDAYGNLAADIFSSPTAEPNTYDNQNSNGFLVSELYASGYITGSIISVLNAEFVTKSEALSAAETLLEQMEAYTAWADENYESIGATASGVTTESVLDVGDGYEHLQAAVALVTGYLVQLSFTLKQERRITLDRDRCVIELLSELYGDVDGQLDFFIQSNNLTGDEILSPGLLKGREIVYYV